MKYMLVNITTKNIVAIDYNLYQQLRSNINNIYSFIFMKKNIQAYCITDNLELFNTIGHITYIDKKNKSSIILYDNYGIIYEFKIIKS